MNSFAFPLSFAQERFWLIQQLERSAPTFNISTALRLRGALDYAALRAALDDLVQRHDSLRTRFPVLDGAPRQFVSEAADLALAEIDLRAESAGRLEQRLAVLLQTENAAPFDLEHDRLIRVILIRLGDEDNVLAVTVHHIICDGWSLNVLLRELTALYRAHAEGRPASLPALEIQYPDYSVWQRTQADDGGFSGQLAYWRGRLANAPRCELPPDFAGPRTHSSAGARHTFTIPAATAEPLRAVAVEIGRAHV